MATPKEEPREGILPPAPPPTKHTGTVQPPAADDRARKDALKSIAAHHRASAWQIHRWPHDKRVLPARTRVHLPRSYLARDGEDVRVVHEGQDLNQFVHKHYLEQVDKAAAQAKSASVAANFVTADCIVTRRHEYLGPDPRVAGYRFDVDGEAHVKWWDAFLQDQWMDKQKWSFDVSMNDEGKWVEVDD